MMTKISNTILYHLVSMSYELFTSYARKISTLFYRAAKVHSCGMVYQYMTYCIKAYPTRIILCMRPASERWHYNVTSSLIGWAHSQNNPCPTIWYFIVLLCYRALDYIVYCTIIHITIYIKQLRQVLYPVYRTSPAILPPLESFENCPLDSRK